jgi:ferritin
MLSPRMLEALNDQINAEFYSSYLYLAMAAYLDDRGLPGCAHWMRVQTREEYDHAMRIFSYVNERNARVTLKAVAEPQLEWNGPTDIFGTVLSHEKLVTSLIHNLVQLAQVERDYPTTNFLQWFVKEQVEEEATAEAILQKFKMVGEQGPPLYMLDRELGTREG